MSQNLVEDSLDEIEHWDEDMCHQNVHEFLPKALSKFEESTFIEDGIRMLQLISRSFVPVMPTEEMEDKIFSRTCKMVCSLMTDVLNKVHLNLDGALKDTAEELKETISECLQWIAVIVESMERWVKQLLCVKDALNLSYLQSLLVCAINVLKQTFSHCKESTDLYGDLLEEVGESLSDLFKKAHSLQSALLTLLDKVTVPAQGYEEHVHILCSVCSGLFEVCKVVNSLDVKLVVSLWKAISKFCSQHLGLMRDRFDVCPLVSYLCEEISSGYDYLFQLCPSSNAESLSQGDDKAFSKWLKIVGFQMKVLVALLRDFCDYLGSCEKDVLCLLLSLHRTLPPCLGATQISESQEGDIRSQIVSATLPILNHLIGNRTFRSLLTDLPQEMNSEDCFPKLLLQLMVLDLLPKCDGDVIDYWLSDADHSRENPTKSLVSVIFDCVRLYSIALVPNMSSRLTDCKSCSMISALKLIRFPRDESSFDDARHYGGREAAEESTLLENILKHDELSCLLATDAWSFMARYGTATLCYNHVQRLILMCCGLKEKRSSTRSSSVRNLTQLIKRLIKFLSPPQQISLTERYPPACNLDLWLMLTLSPFCEQVRRIVGTFMTEHALRIFNSGEVKLSQILQAVACLNQVVSDHSISDACLTQPQKMLIKSIVCQLWTSLVALPNNFGPGKEKLAIELLSVTRHLIPFTAVPDILQVIEILRSYLQEEFSPGLRLMCCHFVSDVMQGVSNFHDPQNLLAADLAELTHFSLLTNTDPLVKSTCISSLAAQAGNAKYQTFISMCIKGDASLNRRFNNFLKKIPFGEENFSILDFLRSQLSCSSSNMSSKEAGSELKMFAHCDNVKKSSTETENEKESPISSSPSCVKPSDFPGEGDDCPPAKRSKLTELCSQDERVNAADFDNAEREQWQAILDGLQKTAGDLEKKCSSTPAPEWFTSAAITALSRVNDCLTVKASWFDSLA